MNMSRSNIADAVDTVGRAIAGAIVVGAVIFMAGPVLVVILLSFSDHTFIQFPPAEWGLRQYRHLAEDRDWLEATKVSFEVAVPTALLAVGLALPAVMALHRTTIRGQAAIAFAAIVPLLIPHVAYAVGMYGVIGDANLIATRTGLVLSHVAITFPLVFLVVSASIVRIPQELELVAMTLGAARYRAWLGITLRLLVPATAAGALLAFVTSFDEPVFASFLGGPGLVTLPKAIFDSVLLGVDPVITAIATILIVATAAVIGCVHWLQRQ